MHSPALAISCEIWNARRAGFLTLLAALPAFAALFHLLAGPLHQSDLLHGFSLVPMILSLFFVFVFFNYTNNNSKSGLAGFPAHLFTRPVRTHVLVATPILAGVATVVGLYAAWVFLVYLPLGIELSVAWPVLILATAMVCYQSIIWSLAGFRLIRLIVMGMVGSILPGALIIHAAPQFKGVLSPRAEAILAGCLLGMSLIAYVTALVSVEWQRHGGGRGWHLWARMIGPIARLLPQRRKPFRSASQAQFWYEWRCNGVVLPYCVVFFMLVVIGPILYFGGSSPALTVSTFCWILFLPIVLAGFMGKGVARSNFWASELTLSSFQATRPILSGSLVLTKLKVAAFSSLVAWIFILIVTPTWLALWCDTSLLTEQWQTFRQHYSPVRTYLLTMLLLLAAVGLTWKLLVSGSWLGLWGRPYLYFGTLIVHLVLVLVACAVCTWIFTHLQEQKAIRAFAPLLKRLFEWVPLLAWVLNGLFIIKVSLAVWSWYRSQQRGLLPASALRAYLLIWLMGTSCLALIPLLIFAPANTDSASSPTEWIVHIAWLKYLLTLATLLLLPWARLGLAPLTLAWNRHR